MRDQTALQGIIVSHTEPNSRDSEPQVPFIDPVVEELKAFNEKLQAMNEELITSNQEMKARVEKLAHANSDLQNLMASTNIATIFLDQQLNIKFYTPRAAELFNLTATDEGQPLSLSRHRLSYDDLGTDAERVLNSLSHVEREVFGDNGHWFLVRVQPYRTVENSFSGVVVTFVDITERKQAEEAVRQSEEHLRAIVHQNLAGIFELDSTGKIIFLNDEFGRMLGYSYEEMLHMGVEGFVHPDDLAENVQKLERMKNTLEAFEMEKRLICKNGEVVWVHNSIAPILDIESRVESVVVFSVDITQRRLAEEAVRSSEAGFRTLADAVPQIIWTNEPNGIATYFNRRWFDYCGLSREESVGPGWQAIVHPSDAPTAIPRWQSALAAGEEFSVEYRLRRADGVYRWHIGRNVPLLDAQGHVLG